MSRKPSKTEELTSRTRGDLALIKQRYLDARCACMEAGANNPFTFSSGSRAFTPYKNFDSYSVQQYKGLYHYWTCPTIYNLVEAAVAFATDGQNVDHFVKKRDYDFGFNLDVDVDELNAEIQVIMECNKWQTLVPEIVRWPYVTGESMLRVHNTHNGIRITMLDPLTIGRPDNPIGIDPYTAEQVKQLAEYGILFNPLVEDAINTGGDEPETIIGSRDYSDPLMYFISRESLDANQNYDYEMVGVDASVVSYSKYPLFTQLPRGLHPWLRIESNSLGIKELMMGARDFALRLAEYAVVETVEGEVTSQDMHDYLEASQQQADNHTKETGDTFLRGAKRVASNVKWLTNSLSMGAQDMIALTEFEKIAIGSQINAPDVISTGRSDMGARNTSDLAMKPWYAHVRTMQSHSKEILHDVLWKSLASLREWDADTLRKVRKQYIMKTTGWTDPAENADSIFKRLCQGVEKNALPPSVIPESMALEYEPEKILEETSAVFSTGGGVDAFAFTSGAGTQSDRDPGENPAKRGIKTGEASVGVEPT